MITATELHSEQYHAEHNPGYFVGGMNIGLRAFQGAKNLGRIHDPLDRIHVMQTANREVFDLVMAPRVRSSDKEQTATYEQANAIFYGAKAAVSMAFSVEFQGVAK